MSTQDNFLENFPAIIKLKQAYKENFTANNIYIEHFLPETKQIIFDGKHKRLIKLSDKERLLHAQECLLNDNSGYFDEFVHDTKLRPDVTEVIRALFVEFYKQ